MSDLMDKIGALLLKAERSDNEHERDAYLAKAQQLATLASVDLEAARMRQTNKEKREQPVSKMIRLFPWSDKSKTKSFFLWLIVEIGHTQDLKFTLSYDSTYVTAYGYPSDIEVTEALYGLLSQQMVTECEAWLKTGEYKKETKRYYDSRHYMYVEKPIDGRTARRSFYEGFRNKIGERLREAKRQTLKDAAPVQIDGESVSTDLVLASKKESVALFYKEKSNARGTYRGNGSGGSSSGRTAGVAAGSRARMGGGGVLSSTRSIAG